MGLPSRSDRTTCPACGVAVKTRKCRVYPKKAPTGWQCEACGEGGSALDAVAFRLGVTLGSGNREAWAAVRAWCAGERFCEPDEAWQGERPPMRPLPKPAEPEPEPSRWRGARIVLGEAWPALRALHRPDLAAAYWRARGVDAASAEALADAPDLVHLPPKKPTGLAGHALALWSLTVATRGDAARPFLALTRDAAGAPRGVQRRCLPGAAKASGGKSKALPGDALPEAFESRPHLLGDARAAARALAAGETVALTEGEVDRSYASTAGLEAFGATSAAGLPRAGKALAEAVAELARTGGLNVRTMGRVVTVAHRGDKPTKVHPEGAGGPCMAEAAEALRVVGVPVSAVVLPLRADGRADLGDVAEGKCGPRAERPELAALDAVREVLASAPAPERPAEVWASTVEDARARVLPELLREALDVAEADRNRLVVVETPPGTGKTHATVPEAIDRAASGGLRVVYATRTHKLAREALDVAELARPGARLRHLGGLESEDADGNAECRALREALDVSPSDGETFARALRNAGRRVCNGCPYRDTCPLASHPKVEPGEVVFVPFQMVRHLAADLVILDDCGKALELAEVPREALADLDRLPSTHREAPAFVRELDAAGAAAWAAFKVRHAKALEARELARSLGEAPPPIPADAEPGYRLTGEALAEALAPAKVSAAAWAAVAPKARKSWPPPNVYRPDGAAQWSGVDLVPDREAVGVASLARQILAAAPDAASPGEALALRMDAGGCTWEVRRSPASVDSPRARAKAALVALDATASRTPTLWAAAAKAAARELRPMALRIAAGPRVPYVWRMGKATNVSRLGDRASGVFTFNTAAPGNLRAALGDLAADLVLLRAQRGNLKAGIITHKALATVLRLGLGLDVSEDDRAGVREDSPALRMGEIAAELRDALGTLEIGHYGADDRGTNRFDDVDALIILGAPRPPLAAVVADADALGRITGEAVDPSELRAEGMADTLAQCVARGRPLSNGRLAVVAGCADHAAPAGRELPGMVPELRDAGAGDRHAWPRFKALARLAADGAAAGVLPATAPRSGDLARALGWAWAEDRQPGQRGRAAAFYAPPGDAWAAYRFRCVFNGLGIYIAQPEGGDQALVEPPPAAPPCSLVGLAHLNRQVPETTGESIRRSAARLVHRRGHGPPTAAALAELAGCGMADAVSAVARVLHEAEAYADATGADWPPPAWAEAPSLPSTPPANEDAPADAPEGPAPDAQGAADPVAHWAGLACVPPEPGPVSLPELRELAARVVAGDPEVSADDLAAEVAFRTGLGSRVAVRLTGEALDSSPAAPICPVDATGAEV